jgi:hypothetical protein
VELANKCYCNLQVQNYVKNLFRDAQVICVRTDGERQGEGIEGFCHIPFSNASKEERQRKNKENRYNKNLKEEMK